MLIHLAIEKVFELNGALACLNILIGRAAFDVNSLVSVETAPLLFLHAQRRVTFVLGLISVYPPRSSHGLVMAPTSR